MGEEIEPMIPSQKRARAPGPTWDAFLSEAGGSITKGSIRWPGGNGADEGDDCDGQPARLRWLRNGTKGLGRPARYVFADQDEIVIAFLPDSAEIGDPPATGEPSDLS